MSRVRVGQSREGEGSNEQEGEKAVGFHALN
jgi:hypothetical protein